MNFIKKHKHLIVYILVVIISLLFVFIGNFFVKTSLNITDDEVEIYLAKVIKITDVEHESFTMSGSEEGKESVVTGKTIFFEAEITVGERKEKGLSLFSSSIRLSP